MFDYLIVGKGLFGAAAARHASAASGSVAVIGPDEPGDPARHAGVFASHYDQGRIQRRLSRDLVWATLAHRSWRAYEHLQAETGFCFYHPVDGVHLVPAGKESIFARAAPEIAARLDVAWTEVTGGQEITARWPGIQLPDDARGFIEHAPAGYVNPRELIRAQLALAEKRGAAIVRDTVVQLRGHERGITASTGGGDSFEARKVLVATGAYTRGMDLLPRPLALRVKSETTLLARLDEREAARLAGMPSVVYELDGPPIDSIYMLPPIRYPDGHCYIKMGCNTPGDTYLATAAEMNQWMRAGRGDAAKEAMIAAMRSILPELEAVSFETKSCMVTYTPSVWPYVDCVDGDLAAGGRLFVATGGNGMGAKSSDAVGKLAADLMVHGRWRDELDRGCFRAMYEDELGGQRWQPSGMAKPGPRDRPA